MITLSQQEARIFALINPAAVDLGLDIVRLRVMGGGRPTLQIMIERTDGGLATIDQCARLSRMISPLLDVHDPVADAYHLEVSTPGIDRPLTREKDFARWAGHLIKLELKTPLEGRRRFRGVILPPSDGVLNFEIDEETELNCQLHELGRADLVLTDALVDAARAIGDMPPQLEDQDLSDFEIDDEGDTPDTETNAQISGAVT